MTGAQEPWLVGAALSIRQLMNGGAADVANVDTQTTAQPHTHTTILEIIQDTILLRACLRFWEI